MLKSILFMGLFSLLLSSCASYTPLSQKQLTDMGTHRFAKVNRAKLTEASAVALETLGYRVTLKQPAAGVVKTSPTTVMTSATGHAHAASVTQDGLAWTLRIEQTGSGAVVRATPRGYRNGSEMRRDGMWVAEVMDQKFQDLWREIDTTLANL